MQKELTKAEEQIMQYLWELKKAFLKDIVERFPEPRPAYTTVSTVIRVMVKKGFIGFNTYGKVNEYYTLISKAKYFQGTIRPIISNYITGSPEAFASFFNNTKLSLTELEVMKKMIEERIKKSKGNRK